MSSIRYRLSVANAAAHIFDIRCEIAQPDPEGQCVRLPAWIPGSYTIRDFARHVIQIEARCEAGVAKLQKIDKHSWRCAPGVGYLQLNYQVYAWDRSVRSAHLDQRHAFFNATSLFLLVAGQEDRACELLIETPPEFGADWRVATSLPATELDTRGFGHYRADDYYSLADHPVEISAHRRIEFECQGAKHTMAITGRGQFDMPRLRDDLQRICEQHIKLFGAPAPFESYLFLTSVVADSYGGLEHRNSCALLTDHAGLPWVGEEPDCKTEAYRAFLGLCSHEYFHAWNVKRIRPQALVPGDLFVENYTQDLWVYEGITSYYDDLALCRAQLISPDQYLEVLARTMTRVRRAAGRTKQTLAESSFDAWIKLYKPDENTANAQVSYYTKGSLFALALDLRLRTASAGAVSLDQLMRLLWERYGRTNIPVAEGAVESLASELLGVDLTAFFDAGLRSTQELSLEELFMTVGVECHWRPSLGVTDRGGGEITAASHMLLGASVTLVDGFPKLIRVHDGGAAQQAGLSAGDLVIAVDGLRAQLDLDAQLAKFAGEPIALTVLREAELMQFKLLAQPSAMDTASLQFIAKPNAAQQSALTAWLGPNS